MASSTLSAPKAEPIGDAEIAALRATIQRFADRRCTTTEAPRGGAICFKDRQCFLDIFTTLQAADSAFRDLDDTEKHLPASQCLMPPP